MENIIQDYSYENCFWDNVDFLYEHSKSKFDEYLSLGQLNYNLAESLINFGKTLEGVKNRFIPYKENDTSSRGKAIQVFLNFINKIINNLDSFAQNFEDLFNIIEEKKTGYESRNEVKKICQENYEQYESNFKCIKTKRNSYYESINQAVEQYLIDINKNEAKISQDTFNKIEICKKKKDEYKEILFTTEKYRIEYIELQRNILSLEEEFERDCTSEIKKYLKKMISFYSDFLKKATIDAEGLEIIEEVDGTRDNQIFAEENRTIYACPPRVEFQEYTQELEIYLNFDLIKNKIKSKPKELKEIKNKIGTEVKQFLRENIILENNNDHKKKFDEVADNILNKELNEEEYNYLIDEFKKTYDKFLVWERENKIETLEFKKVGEEWDNRFDTMQLFLDSFNRVRNRNKELTTKNYEYFTKALDNILSFNKYENIDYKLCELLLTLSSTFYTMEKVGNEERKKYASEYIKNNPIIQSVWFWVGLTKFELSGEILKEKEKEKEKEENTNFNLSSKKTLLTKKKKMDDKEIKGNKKKGKQMVSQNVVAKLMSISYNLLQFIKDSETLNYSMANIFRNFKISQENKQMIITMLKTHIELEKIKHLKINEEFLLNCDKVDYFIKSKENKTPGETDEGISINKQKDDNDINKIKTD
jgi:hypothetical protein